MNTQNPVGAVRILTRMIGLFLVLEACVYLGFLALDIADFAPERAAIGVGAGILLAGYGLLHLWAAWQLQTFAEHSRGLIACLQIVQLGIAWSWRDMTHWWMPATLAGAAIVVLYLVFQPSITREIRTDDAM